MTIFVTGGSGFVGLNLLEQLLAGRDSIVSSSLSPPLSIKRTLWDTAYNPHLALERSFDDYLGWMEG